MRESACTALVASASDCSAITVQGAPSTETGEAAARCGPSAEA